MIGQPKFWSNNNLISVLLLPLSYFYYFVTWFIKANHSPYISKSFIICIGNLTVGGNGKTPTVCLYASYLQKVGFKVVIASRGYKGKKRDIKKVNLDDDPKIVGDEALILAKVAPCYIGSKKKKLIITIEQLEKPDIIILDDGLQNFSVQKDYEIVVIDGFRGFGNGRILPAGPLREKVDPRLRAANHIILIGEDKTEVKSYVSDKRKIINGNFVPINQETIKASRYIAFAGIGNPEKFFFTLKENNYNVIKTVFYPDHYSYKLKDVEHLSYIAKQENAKLITTLKDGVKLPIEFKEKVEILEIELSIDSDRFLKNIVLAIKKTLG